MSHLSQTAEEIIELLKVQRRLRSETGCSWDRAQTAQSLKRYLIEESYELLEAIDLNDRSAIQEELGDVLLQVIFHTEIQAEQQRFELIDVVRHLKEKLIRRHPHVFGNEQPVSADDALRNWELIKLEEKKQNGKSGVLSGVPKALPSLQQAYRLGQKASKVGFDWPSFESVWKKVKEETAEFEEAVLQNDPQKMKEELGDLLFSIAQAARFFKENPEEILHAACQKFTQRFEQVEQEVNTSGRSWTAWTADELEAAWQRAKRV